MAGDQTDDTRAGNKPAGRRFEGDWLSMPIFNLKRRGLSRVVLAKLWARVVQQRLLFLLFLRGGRS